MLILPRLLALVPYAQAILWVMLVFALWSFRDLLINRRLRTRTIAGARRRGLRWKLAVLSSLAATELVICMVGVLAAA